MKSEIKIKLPCGGIIKTTKSLLNAGGTFICSKGCEHLANKVVAQLQSINKKRMGGG